MKKVNYVTWHKKVPIPSWALCYLINADDSGLESEDKKIVDDWVEEMREGGRIDVCCPNEGEEAYFSGCPAFGLACDVEDCDVLIDRSPKYKRCDRPCLGQSRFEPLRRQALDGRWWWVLYDNKEGRFVPHSQKFKTRIDLIKRLFIDFTYGNMAYEPDDDRHTVEWLKNQKDNIK